MALLLQLAEDAPVSGHAADGADPLLFPGRLAESVICIEGSRRWRCYITVSRGRPRLGSRCRWRRSLALSPGRLAESMARVEGRRRWRCYITVSRGRPRLGSRCRWRRSLSSPSAS
ncbi:hypothetical protein C7M84_015949 [Penaeus vannamei]|uniref:Uncharacterized protein n=1 Tax=Penaeus vannamei TaxID=6689 RepID=A0A3R7LXT2_PENVA|nr:hypothetical protein C7M84_015949 [Penaeus vannamei]